jgi:hypothetical protein
MYTVNYFPLLPALFFSVWQRGNEKAQGVALRIGLSFVLDKIIVICNA